VSDLGAMMHRILGHPSPGDMGDYPPCDCGHQSPRHHGDDRSGRPAFGPGLSSTGCKECSWCDYYKPRHFGPAYEEWAAARERRNAGSES
jgi:hypothetical protein